MSAHASQQRRPYEIEVRHPRGEKWLSEADTYSLATAYVKGLVDVHGDFMEAVRDHLTNSAGRWRSRFLDWVVARWRITSGGSKRAAARNIQFHYDRSNDFYRLFLDSNMVYSCAYFRDAHDSLDQAQIAKLDYVCRKLRLASNDRFLDIGCGWGALLERAANRFHARATGCTLSHLQFEYATERMRRANLTETVSICEKDYRDLAGPFDKIASVGMVEHVGKAHLEEYFRKVYRLLTPDGLFLNHGITRPKSVPPSAQTLFILRKVFPGSEIVGLDDMIRAAELAGFEALDVENLYRHYALTSRTWAQRLSDRRDECLKLVDEETWRTWQLYLAGCSVAFERGEMGLHQILFAKRGASQMVPLSREYMYADQPGRERLRAQEQ